MQYLNTLLTLLSKTESRDKVLRVVQYATLYSQDHKDKGPAYNVYVQMRRTRKILRFLRTLHHIAEIRKDLEALPKQQSNLFLALKIFTILQNLFTLLFYVFDHGVFLGQLQVISKQGVQIHYPRSMKMYLLQNVVGIFKNVTEIAVIFMEGVYEGKMVDMQGAKKILMGKFIQIIRNILDVLVANYYINKPQGKAGTIGVIGVITSLIGIAQSLKYI